MRATCCMRHGAPPKRPENLSNSNQQCFRVIPWPSSSRHHGPRRWSVWGQRAPTTPGITSAVRPADLALAAFSPVAIIRRRHTHKTPPAGTWIVAALDRSPEVSTVLQTAMNEAMLRDTPILALTRWSTAGRPEGEPNSHHDVRAKLVKYLQEAGEDAADVEICTLPMSERVANVLAQSADIDQLVIIGPDDPISSRKLLVLTPVIYCGAPIFRFSFCGIDRRTRQLPWTT